MHAMVLKDSLKEQAVLIPTDNYLFAKVESSNTFQYKPKQSFSAITATWRTYA
jgi:hypothetical protein